MFFMLGFYHLAIIGYLAFLAWNCYLLYIKELYYNDKNVR